MWSEQHGMLFGAEEPIEIVEEYDVYYQVIDGDWKVLYADRVIGSLSIANDPSQNSAAKYNTDWGFIDYAGTLGNPDIMNVVNVLGANVMTQLKGRGIAMVQLCKDDTGIIYFLEFCIRLAPQPAPFVMTDVISSPTLQQMFTNIANGIDPNVTIDHFVVHDLGYRAD